MEKKFYLEQIYTDCLAEASYFIESDGQVAIIDPLRNAEPYLEKVSAQGAEVKYIFETHFHADFVSGHLELQRETGATIVYGPNAETEYDIHNALDGEVFELGHITIKAIHTPGHTLESTCYLLIDDAGKPQALFSGDTLFIGDVGRPDLAIKSELTKEDLAGMLYDSIHNKIAVLDDDVIIYPAHGPGSSCGKNMCADTFSSLKRQKQENFVFLADSKERFVQELTSSILPPPQYFSLDAQINKKGYEPLKNVLSRGINPLTAEQVQQHIGDGVLLLDTRTPEAFEKEHIPGSIFIGLDGMFAIWVGTLITDIDQPIILLTEEGKHEEAIERLARVGYDNCIGYVNGEVGAWKEAGFQTGSISSISAHDLSEKLSHQAEIIDVRKPSEYETARVANAVNIPLDFIENRFAEFEKFDQPFIYCQTGYRSMITISILRAKGYMNAINVKGGFEGINKDAKSLIQEEIQVLE